MIKRKSNRKGVATVEFAVCAPILLLVGFGFINVGILVQLKHNSRMIGHLAATEVFKAPVKDAFTVGQIEAKFEQMAADLGIESFDLEITQHSQDIAVIKTDVEVSANCSIPTGFTTCKSLESETFVFSHLE